MLSAKLRERMTVQDRVADLVRHISPHAICDDCIARELGLTIRQHANHKTRELAGSAGFKREIDLCYKCNTAKTVILHA